MYKAMKTLISKEFYDTSEDAQKKLDVFYAVSRRTEDEYTELTATVQTVYCDKEQTESTI